MQAIHKTTTRMARCSPKVKHKQTFDATQANFWSPPQNKKQENSQIIKNQPPKKSIVAKKLHDRALLQSASGRAKSQHTFFGLRTSHDKLILSHNSRSSSLNLGLGCSIDILGLFWYAAQTYQDFQQSTFSLDTLNFFDGNNFNQSDSSSMIKLSE